MNSLDKTASKEEVLKRISSLKITALNLITKKLTENDSKYLEPREIKTLIDTNLSIEDSVRDEQTEGSHARAIKRLMDKYGDADSIPTNNNSMPKTIEAKVVKNG